MRTFVTLKVNQNQIDKPLIIKLSFIHVDNDETSLRILALFNKTYL